MGVNRFLFLIALVALLATAIPPALADQYQAGLPVNGCAIRAPSGLVPDRDCDGIDDFHDNCKYVPNTDQADSNRNGIGDKCDLLVTSIDLDPGTQVQQGSFFTVRVQLINNKDYGITDIQARIRNDALAVDLPSHIDAMRPGEQRIVDFVVKVPGCAAPGRYELTFTTDHTEGAKTYTQTLYQRIEVVRQDGACAASDTVLDNTVIDTITQQEAAPGESVIYPITITNLNGEAKTYTIGLGDINGIGTYRIDPASTFTVPAGKSQAVYLYVQTESFAPVGRNTLDLALGSGDETQTVTLGLRIIKSVGASMAQVLMSVLQIALVIVVLGLIVGAGIVAYKKIDEEHDEGERRPPKPPKKKPAVEDVKDDDEFQSYY